MRVSGFTQDDAHVFCLPSQLSAEICSVLDLVETILGRFGFRGHEVILLKCSGQSVGNNDGLRDSNASLEAAIRDKGEVVQRE